MTTFLSIDDAFLHLRIAKSAINLAALPSLHSGGSDGASRTKCYGQVSTATMFMVRQESKQSGILSIAFVAIDIVIAIPITHLQLSLVLTPLNRCRLKAQNA